MTTNAPVCLCILDGWGLTDRKTGNAPKLARTPVMDRLMATCPNATLITHGPDVGLPTGQMGNSEVGHTNIGAGRIVAMDLGQIDLSIEDGSFDTNTTLQTFISTLQARNGSAHLIGLVSPGGVHAHQNHMIHAASVIAAAGVPVEIHILTDGRDVAPSSARQYVGDLMGALPPQARLTTLCGRYFALDRDHRWDRVEQAFAAIALGKGERAKTAMDAIEAAYARGETDEFISPTVLSDRHPIDAGKDGVFFLNFRADRGRQILQALVDPAFEHFDRGEYRCVQTALGMVEYSDHLNQFLSAVFPSREIVNTLGAWVAKAGKRQFRLAETEKYPHVTFFLNGGKEAPEPREERYMAPSPKVATYDLAPQMAEREVTERFKEAIQAGFDLIVTNYANPDMVGHTGDLEAAIAACEAVDQGLGEVIDTLQKVGGAMVICADHGNCEEMIDPKTGGPHTAHTTNLVPVILCGGPEGSLLRPGRLADLSPTLLDLMGLDKPPEMTGESLVIRRPA